MPNSCVMHHHTGSTPGIMVWDDITYHSHTPLVCIAGTLYSQRYISKVLDPIVLPYLQGLATAILQQDNEPPYVTHIVQRFFINQQIELLSWPAHSPDLSPLETCGSWFLNDWPRLDPQLPHQTPFGKVWKLLGLMYPQEHIQSIFESKPRCVAAVISNNVDYSGY
ncbi:transposable element Tcb1 transposase [Trichonephila clavipes]|nr:transposable element Tcb1 transposase [Trichonephila clavipes]